ncbi:hypothetical protein TWF128_008607 [Orbilia oligospora]|nr:hypothetical protein TWF128_008607 [Orbilia oligospora]
MCWLSASIKDQRSSPNKEGLTEYKGVPKQESLSIWLKLLPVALVRTMRAVYSNFSSLSGYATRLLNIILRIRIDTFRYCTAIEPRTSNEARVDRLIVWTTSR